MSETTERRAGWEVWIGDKHRYLNTRRHVASRHDWCAWLSAECIAASKTLNRKNEDVQWFVGTSKKSYFHLATAKFVISVLDNIKLHLAP